MFLVTAFLSLLHRVYARFSPELRLLYRHIAEGEEDYLQPQNQLLAGEARMQRPAEIGDNNHITVGAVRVDDWRRSAGGSSLAKL